MTKVYIYRGTTTTLKIYNKLLEFKKHDLKKFSNSNFNVFDYLKEIQGFVRFECEIKKKMLKSIFEDKKKHILVIEVNYDILKNIWKEEFMKVLQFIKNDLEIVRGRKAVYQRLNELYKPSRANQLYYFYCSIQLNRIKRYKKFNKLKYILPKYQRIETI